MGGVNLLKECEFIPVDFFCLKWKAKLFVESEWVVVSIARVIEKILDKGLG